ncbi:bone morphogenetic protein 3 [Grus japonensis]|uniref:Bone morphogenetic protein 3 n=1 Tax=Grus japonensis TaxID=30415 RepID=A0ABC9WWR3_GRUJA
MAPSTRWVLCLCLALGDVPKPCRIGLRQRAAQGGEWERAAVGDYGPGQRQQPEERCWPECLQSRDKVSKHMLRFYNQYAGYLGGQHSAWLPPAGNRLPHEETAWFESLEKGTFIDDCDKAERNPGPRVP